MNQLLKHTLFKETGEANCEQSLGLFHQSKGKRKDISSVFLVALFWSVVSFLLILRTSEIPLFVMTAMVTTLLGLLTALSRLFSLVILLIISLSLFLTRVFVHPILSTPCVAEGLGCLGMIVPFIIEAVVLSTAIAVLPIALVRIRTDNLDFRTFFPKSLLVGVILALTIAITFSPLNH